VVQVKAQGDTVRGSLHKDTYYGKIKLKKAGTEDYEEHVVLRKPIVGMSKADMAKVVDPALRQALLDADPDTIEKHRGLPWKGKHKGVPVTRVVKHARVFDRSVKNPVALKAHRDKLDGTDHKHHLWVKNDETPVMAIYENAKGKSTHYVFSLLELTLAQKGKQGRDLLMQAIPAKHPDPKREGYTLKYRNGKPMVLQAGQLVRLFKDGPEEIDHNDQVDLNRRTYVLRKVEADGRVNLLNVLEARPDDQIDETNQWKPEQPLQWLRFSVHGLKAEIDGIDTTIGMVHT
jgi:CRISPR-associated endonuclease Csn1